MTRSMLSSSIPTYGSPRWAGDYRHPAALIPGGARLDTTAFTAADAVVVDVGAAGAAQGAVSVPVLPALTGDIPSGTVLYFGGAKVAVLSAPAAKGAVTIAVNALPTALVDADKATYAGIGLRTIPSGTIIGRTLAERDAVPPGPYGPAADADDEIFITAFEISDAIGEVDCTLYRPNFVVYENFLPRWADISAAVKAKVRGLYICSLGQV